MTRLVSFQWSGKLQIARSGGPPGPLLIFCTSLQILQKSSQDLSRLQYANHRMLRSPHSGRVDGDDPEGVRLCDAITTSSKIYTPLNLYISETTLQESLSNKMKLGMERQCQIILLVINQPGFNYYSAIWVQEGFSMISE